MSDVNKDELFFEQIHIARIKYDKKLNVTKILSYPDAISHLAHMKQYKHFDNGLFVSDEHKESTRRLLFKTIKTKRLHSSKAYVYLNQGTSRPEFDFLGTRWFELQRHAAPTDTGGVILTTISIPSSMTFQNVFNNLHDNKLHLQDDVCLTRKDLKILHYYLSGLSAGDTAETLFVSKRSVQTTIARIKNKLYFDTDPDISLIQNLNKRDLIQFIMEKPDWFAYIKNQTTQWSE